MDISHRFPPLIVILFQLLWFCDLLQGDMRYSKSYSLTRNCKSLTFDNEYSRKLKLNINLTGALIRSHEDYLSDSIDRGVYPDNLSCELVAEAPLGSRIMLLIESLHIPTDNLMCDENYLYVFDFESSRSKAMAAAGGEKGLCGRTYPRFPIITTGPFITIVFNSKIKSHKVPHDAGFLLTLTEILPVDRNNRCQSDRYQCGPMNPADIIYQRHKRRIIDKTVWPIVKDITPRVTKARLVIPKVSKTTVINYCIPLGLICDGVRNCHDASDEDSKSKKFCSDFQKTGILNKFLSLGLSASIAIAVTCIIAITLCIGLTACYCVRLCTSESHCQQPQLTKEVMKRPEYQGMVISPAVQGVNVDGHYTSHFFAQPSGFISVRDNSSASSFETDKMYCLYQDPSKIGYLNITRPASEKMCHWGTSSLLSYPSHSEGHHSHPETPYFMRDVSKNNRSPHQTEHIVRSSFNNPRCHHNSYSHQTPTSSRSAKSTRSTKSSNVDKKNGQINESRSINHNGNKDCGGRTKYPLILNETKIRVLGSVLGQV